MRAERQRGPEGQWLRDARRARGYTNAHKASAAMHRMTGHLIHYSAWAAYEAGSRPIGDQHREWLEEFFGPMPSAPAAGDGDLAAAIRDLADAVRAQTKAQDDWLRGTVRGLLSQLGLPAELLVPDAPSSPEPPAQGQAGG